MFKVVMPIHKDFFLLVKSKNDFKILNSFEELKKSKINSSDNINSDSIVFFDFKKNFKENKKYNNFDNFLFLEDLDEKQIFIFNFVKSIIIKNDFENYKSFILNYYSEKLKDYNVVDETIIKLNNLIDDSKKNLNRLGLRFEQLLDLFYPEIVREVKNYVVLAKLFSEKKIEEYNKDNKYNNIVIDIPDDIYELLFLLSKRILVLEEDINLFESKLKIILEENYPNFTFISSYKIASKLISLAGSFENIVFMPSSRLQILGAEKALFRHLKNKKFDPPKYGVLHEHPFMSKVKSKYHGKLARLLADKILIAAKIDYFRKKEDKTKSVKSNVDVVVKKYYDNIVKKVEEYSKG